MKTSGNTSQSVFPWISPMDPKAAQVTHLGAGAGFNGNVLQNHAALGKAIESGEHSW